VRGRKQSLKKKLEKENDKIWSLIVRHRANGVCQKCGTRKSDLEAHHIFSRANKGTRWDTHNGIALCFYCHHVFFHRHPAESTLWVKEWLGEATFNYLFEQSKKPVKYDTNFVKDWNEKLKKEFQSEFGMPYEEYRKQLIRRHK